MDTDWIDAEDRLFDKMMRAAEERDRRTLTWAAAGAIVGALLGLIAMAGCTTTRPATVGAPSTAAVRDQIHNASASTQAASAAVAASGQSNRKISSALDTIDAKLIILDRWQQTHRPKQ